MNKIQPSVVTIVAYEVQELAPVAIGEGSGVVISADGYIVTNAHVVDYSREIGVVVINAEGIAYDAFVVGYDERTDLAVVKTKADEEHFIPAEFGESTSLRAGDSIFAIGNPGGLQYAGTVTKGIVSATARVVEDGNNRLALIQTDAAINPGNSGGALVNQYGQVVGITSAKIVSTSYEGMGFAIPISSAEKVVNDLLRYGSVQNRVQLGITYTTVSPVTAVFYDWPQGIQINGLSENSVFLGTGVKAKDIITEINGQRIINAAQLYETLDQYKPGDAVNITLYRYAQKKTFQVEVILLGEE